ncbi:ABC transporter substrate-binding protein [Candidatus Nucleicultrix amoebiphila]|jgi:ABC-type branched-subunit amino acid transport system substrate-binding protein|uniref:Serine/threonine specific protein phosphatases domain-containing protein n=1 Tax=Candidatus Nucleicultrix amoebiphila FS5 TaxID=1414854 RepID=A0A1W6N5U6_9PROT|nr:ABC transporter substrate-binding protein [Candidatus Nucleicultrix amoebiphila]ARN85139.1 hypothetical protein GQ61_07415 [Candidatus Nucleicultrix amoebiphila FS5]
MAGKFLIGAIVGFLFSLSSGNASPITLKSFQDAAKELPEFPVPDNDNLLNPDYTTYHQTITPGFFKEVFNFSVFVGKEPLWTKKKLTNSLKEAFNKSAYTNKDSIFIQLTPGDQLVVWGDIHGAFHALVRSLNQLKKEGYIDESLKILKPNIKFIFMGNIIDRSPFNLETLTLVLSLINKNPQQVIYLRGSHEHHQAWRFYDFQREIKIRLRDLPEKDAYFVNLKKYFDSLPTKIFFEGPSPQTGHLVFNSLYETKAESLSEIRKPIEVLIANQSRSRMYQATPGLSQLPPTKGIQNWTLFSSPTLSFQRLYNFYNDSFSIIDVGQTLYDSNITLYSHKVSDPSLEFSQNTFHLISGEPMNRTMHKFVKYGPSLGCSLDLSGAARIVGERARAGIDLRVRKLNREGGIHKELLKVYFEDDEYSPSLTLKNVTNFLKTYNTDIVFSFSGTTVIETLFPLIQNKKILVLFPSSGASILRKNELSYIIHFKPSVSKEVEALVKYAVETLLKRQFAVFYQDDDFGREALTTAKKMLKEQYNVPESRICQVSYPRNSVNVEKAVEIIQSCNPDVIFLFSRLAPSKELVNKLGISFLSNTILMGTSILSDRFKDFVSGLDKKDQPGKGLSFIISRTLPNPDNENIEIIKEYHDEMQRVYPGTLYDTDSLEGYINTSLLIEVLKNLPSPLNLDKIIASFEAMKNTPFKGLSLDFNPETRELSKNVWLDVGKKDWILIEPSIR